MKALLGELAKEIKNDPSGKEQLKGFISSSSKSSEVITLSNGKKYRITPFKGKSAIDYKRQPYVFNLCSFLTGVAVGNLFWTTCYMLVG